MIYDWMNLSEQEMRNESYQVACKNHPQLSVQIYPHDPPPPHHPIHFPPLLVA